MTGWWWPIVLAVGLIVGCGESPRRGPIDRDASGEDGPPADVPIVRPDDRCVTALPVDLIWVIDNSHSMGQEQLNLGTNFPSLVKVLTEPPDSDRDGQIDYPPVRDLRMGVITTDLGTTAGADWEGSCDPFGDQGVFVSSHQGDDPACSALSVPGFLSYGGGDATAFAQDFSCLARLGTSGCGFEQQLEAALLAVTDRAQPGQANADFLRTDSLVAIIFVTDEDDCSAADRSLFAQGAAARTQWGEPGLRCGSHPEALHPIDRYVTAFKGLRLDRRGDVVVAAVTGVPDDLVRDAENVDYATLLADPRMQFRPGALDSTQPEPACDFPGVGSAAPARRLVQVVQSFAADGKGIVQSICNTNLEPAVEAIARLISKRVCPEVI